MILHVTNGDCAGEPLKRIFPADRVLVWRDVLYNRLYNRPERMALPDEWDEIVLWFEHDLYDQLQLLELLSLLNGRDNITLINHNDYLGPMSQEALAALFPTRRPVTADQYREAGLAWAAFRAPEPHGLTGFPIFRRLSEEYPAVEDGCTRTERFILRTLAAGYRDPGTLFREFNASEDPKWMGDWPFFDVLTALKSGAQPLVNELNQVTPKGRAVLEGRDDRILGNGIDRWIGGVHLHGDDTPWRWDGGLRQFLPRRTRQDPPA